MKWIIAAIGILAPANLVAQPSSDHPGFVFGGVAWVWEEGVTTDEHRTYLAAPGGSTRGWAIGGGVFVNRWWALQGELRRTGVMEATEPSRYYFTYSVARRDTTVSVGARFRLRIGGSVTMEPVAMFDFVREESWLGEVRHIPGLPPSGDLSQRAPFVNRTGPGLTGGVDVRVGGKRFALMPGFRTRWMARGDRAISTWPGGRSSWGLEGLLAARVDF